MREISSSRRGLLASVSAFFLAGCGLFPSAPSPAGGQVTTTTASGVPGVSPALASATAKAVSTVPGSGSAVASAISVPPVPQLTAQAAVTAWASALGIAEQVLLLFVPIPGLSAALAIASAVVPPILELVAAGTANDSHVSTLATVTAQVVAAASPFYVVTPSIPAGATSAASRSNSALCAK